MKRPALLLVALTACETVAPSPRDADVARQNEIAALVARTGDPQADRRLIAHGDAAVAELVRLLQNETQPPPRRGRAAMLLASIRRATGNATALAAYGDVLRDAPAPLVRELLPHAHAFGDAEGGVAALLLAFISKMPGVTAPMVLSAGAITDTEGVEAMKAYVLRTKDADRDDARDAAMRYVGRASRRGRKDAVEFLVNCAAVGDGALYQSAERELLLLSGRQPVKNWRGWWLEHARESRHEWIAQALRMERNADFDPSTIEAWAWLIERLDLAEDREPEFALAERTLGLRLGYVSVRDVFDPTVAEESIREANERAVALLKRWWTENRAFLKWGGERRMFEVDRAAREKQ